MQKIILFIILFFSISYSQQFNYSKMSNVEKILIYNEMKKNPVGVVGLNILLPLSGYFLLDNELAYKDWNSFKNSFLLKGIVMNGTKLTLLGAYFYLSLESESKDNNAEGCWIGSIDSIDEDECRYEEAKARQFGRQSYASAGLMIGLSLFEIYYLLNETSKYNQSLKTIL